jgi:hypothetical protein
MSDENKKVVVDEKNGSNKKYYIGFFVVCLLVALFYFVVIPCYQKNMCGDDSFVEGNRQERDDPISDYNLHEAVANLEKTQKSLISKLSSTTNLS